jgi:hypothetical protein
VRQFQLAHQVGDADAALSAATKMPGCDTHNPFTRFLFVFR